MFGVPKHIALKIVIEINYVLQKTFFKIYKPQFSLVQQKIRINNEETQKNCNILSSKTPKNDLLTLN